MRKIKEVLRLKYEQNMTNRAIAASANIGVTTVSRYIHKARAAGLQWPLPADITEQSLNTMLFKVDIKKKPWQVRLPDCEWIHQEMKRKGVTLFLLWEEYKQREPRGCKYSRFCQIYRAFKTKLSPSLRQTHIAGDKLFVDYSGLTVPWRNNETGVMDKAEIFVAVLGASNYTFIRAYPSQCLSDWIDAHIKAFEFFGGTAKTVVPDNLRSGVSKAHRYDPDINPTYQDMATHYQIAVVPARVYSPKDKAKAEVGVQGIQRRILAPLRDHAFFSVSDINQAISSLLKQYNEQAFQQLPGSRLTQFELLDKPKLKPLPIQPYEFAIWKKVKVATDYHIVHEQHYYSVPYQYIKQVIDCRISRNNVECFLSGKRIAHHKRAYFAGHTTLHGHMPKSHKEYMGCTLKQLRAQAKAIGSMTEKLVGAILADRPKPQQGVRACLGVLRLGKKYGNDRLENASIRALELGIVKYQPIESMLKNGLEKITQPSETADIIPCHENVRGSAYFITH